MKGVPETPQSHPHEPQDTAPVPPAPGPAGPAGKETNPDARLWGMLCHLAGLAGLLPFGSIIGPLVVWLIKKETHPFVDEQGKESLNFQITMLIYAVSAALFIPLCGIGFVLVSAVGIVDIVFVIIGALKANEGEHYRHPYPLIFRFIK